MKFLLRVWAIFIIAIKRLYAQKGLALATLLGLIVTIALALSVPLYADAVYFRVLQEELTSGATAVGSTTRSPFAFMYRYIGAWNGLVSLEDVQQVDEYLSEQAAFRLGLPQGLYVRYFKTDNFRLFPAEDIAYADVKDPLAWVNFGFVTNIENYITILEGNFPAEAVSSPDSTVEVLISQNLATELGLQVGETLMTFQRREVEGIQRTTQIPIQIAGVWQATDPSNPFWFYTPETLEELFLVPEGTFFNRIGPYMEDEVALALWYLLMDGSEVTSSDALPLLRRINATQQRVSALLPGTSLDVSPADALQRYQQGVSLLTVLLYAFSVPILALILIFISLVVGLSVGRQRNEIAVLRSRGATTSQVIGIAVLEGVLMGLIALIIGLPIGEMVAQVIGQTQSFLNFSGESGLRVSVTTTTLRFGFMAVGLALAAQIGPTLGAARHTIVSYKQTQARLLRPPWWQRVWLDLLLLIPAGYGTYLLQQQGSIVGPADEQIVNSSPFQNPLLLLVPALGILALTLLFLRFLPLIMSILAWVISHFGGVGLLLATRQLSRTPGFYAAPMVLLVLTLSLSAFTASLAQTLDNHLYDQAYYEVGADMSLVDFGQASEEGGLGGGNPFGGGGAEAGDGELAQTASEEETGPRWYFLPVTEYLKAPGVLDATRVGEYGASTRLSGGSQTGTFVGVDRVNFSGIAYWRWDFAPSYLAEMMNALAIAPDGVLLPRTFIRQHALNVGDTIQVSVNLTGQRVEMPMKVMGGFDLFPAWYPEEEGPLFVGNLDYLFEQAGGQYPYNVWLKTEPSADYIKIIEDARGLQLRILDSDVAGSVIIEEQKNPQRQGLFGLLSVGFGSAALLTVLGFLLYALFSFRQRFIELGVLRAIGLSSGQMTIFLAWELAFLILTGVLLGTGLGIWASQLYIPFLQVGADEAARIPPFLVEIAWPAIVRIYILFSLLFVIALAVLATLLLRMKIFQAVKLGETV
jgi:putative ABC transport system permease protein